jgi:hypothetical protein
MASDEYGPTEAAYRRWIAGLGELSPRQAAEAEQVYAVARRLDNADGGAASSLSRELRQLSAALREVRAAPAAESQDAAAPPVDPVDELARLRAERRKGSA